MLTFELGLKRYITFTCWLHFPVTGPPETEVGYGQTVCRWRRGEHGGRVGELKTFAAHGQTHSAERSSTCSSPHWYQPNCSIISSGSVSPGDVFTDFFQCVSYFRSLLVCFNPLFFPALFYLLISSGGYDIIKTRKGKGACVSIATAYEDVFLDTFNLEIDLKPTVKISRHNIPPFIPLNNLAEQNNMQTDLRVFLDTLSKHLNAFAGRKQQLKLVKVPDFTFLNYISPYPSVADVDSIMSAFWEGKAICCRTPCLGGWRFFFFFKHISGWTFGLVLLQN